MRGVPAAYTTHRTWGIGGIGRRDGFKLHWETVWVQVPHPLPKGDIMALQKYTKEWLEELCASSYSYAEVLRKAGRAQAGGSQETLKKKIVEFGIDVSHFTGQRWKTESNFEEKYTKETLFVKGNQVSNLTLRRYIEKYKLLPYICSCCGCNGSWMGGILSLQLHHKDGDRTNNEVDNLTYLCPNCHAITDSYGGKNNEGQKRVK